MGSTSVNWANSQSLLEVCGQFQEENSSIGLQIYNSLSILGVINYSSSQKGCRGVLDFPSSKLSLDFPPRQKKNCEKHHRIVWSRKACAHKTQVMPKPSKLRGWPCRVAKQAERPTMSSSQASWAAKQLTIAAMLALPQCMPWFKGALYPFPPPIAFPPPPFFL
jgi:hypothetical protein